MHIPDFLKPHNQSEFFYEFDLKKIEFSRTSAGKH